LPPVLRERYKFAQAELLGLRALLIIDSNPEEQPPATVRKHMDMLQARQQADLIYVRAQVTAYNRKRLIEQKVPFIVPGNQMYLPMLAMIYANTSEESARRLPPSALPRRSSSSMHCSAMQGR